MKHFDFGKNWVSFSWNALTNNRMASARRDFGNLFSGISLKGKTFLDIGFGQGLSLLCALEQGAQVTGCDINPQCSKALAITAEAFGIRETVQVITGSILDEAVVEQLGGGGRKYDIVHSWGVLHHTGKMYAALSTACNLTAENGYLVIAIYNRHWSCAWWGIIKKMYCSVPHILQKLMVAVMVPVLLFAKYCVTRKNPLAKERGMEFMHDVVDWVGGWPYEYASICEIKAFVEQQGFTTKKVQSAAVPTGCNEFIFRKSGRLLSDRADELP